MQTEEGASKQPLGQLTVSACLEAVQLRLQNNGECLRKTLHTRNPHTVQDLRVWKYKGLRMRGDRQNHEIRRKKINFLRLKAIAYNFTLLGSPKTCNFIYVLVKRLV